LTFDPGIIKGDIDPVKLLDGCFNGFPDIVFASNVTGNKKALPSGFFNKPNNLEAKLLTLPTTTTSAPCAANA
jgi:hypothetical protein